MNIFTANLKDTIKLVENGADVNAINEVDETLLYKTIRLGDYSKAIYLIDKGAELDTITYLSDEFFNIRFYTDELVKAFIRNGYDINKLNCSGQNVLYTMYRGADVLIRNGINWKIKDVRGQTPLFNDNMIYYVELFVDVINEKDNDGRTALFYADKNYAKVLIKYGVDVMIKDNNGNYAEDINSKIYDIVMSMPIKNR